MNFIRFRWLKVQEHGQSDFPHILLVCPILVDDTRENLAQVSAWTQGGMDLILAVKGEGHSDLMSVPFLSVLHLENDYTEVN